MAFDNRDRGALFKSDRREKEFDNDDARATIKKFSRCQRGRGGRAQALGAVILLVILRLIKL
jgi:hypothetical protein